MCDALTYLYSYISFGTNLHTQIVGFPMGTNCAPLVADLFVKKKILLCPFLLRIKLTYWSEVFNQPPDN